MKLSREEYGNLFENLGRLMSAGISVGDSFTLLSEDAAQKDKELYISMAKAADKGKPLSEIIGDVGIFESYCQPLIKISEQTGKTERCLFELSRHYKARNQMMKSFRSSIVSPLFLLGVLISVILILIVWVLPVFSDVYNSLGGTTGGLSGALLAFGNSLRTALPYILIAIVLLALLVSIPALRRKIKTLFVCKFGDKGAYAKINSSVFVSALSMAIAAGMTEENSVQLAANVSNNSCNGFCSRCDLLVSMVKSGSSLSSSLKACGFITNSQARQLEIGKKSGKQDEAIANLANETRALGEIALQKSLGLVEPAIVAAACIMIGGILLSVMLPLINIMNSIG